MKDYYIGIVIVNYNGASYQNECIESILNSTYQNYHIFVIDNASKDNSMELLDVFHSPKITKIFARDNLGVAAGNNIGIEASLKAKTDATLFLNNDTVLQKDTLEKLVNYLPDEEIICPIIYYWSHKDTFWYGGGHFDMKRGTNYHDHYMEKDTGQKFPDYCDYASTCCLLVKNDVFDKIGQMDPIYFMYSDDTDFAMRAKLKGIKIRLVSDSRMYHKVSLSTGGEKSRLSVYYINRNRFFFVKRYKKYFSWTAYPFTYWSRKIRYLESFFKDKNNRVIKKAYKDYKAGRMGRCDNL